MKKRSLTYIKSKSKAIDKLSQPKIYLPSTYGISDKYTGINVKIAIIDSGLPDHKDIKINDIEINKKSHSFCDNTKNVYDKLGHSSILTGIIKSKNDRSIIGLAPNVDLYFAKIIDDYNCSSFNSLVAAILWAIIKKVDIITISLGTDYNYQILHDAIKKAHNENICICAAGGDKIQNATITFPAKYPEVFSVNSLSIKKLKEKIDFVIPTKNIYSTYIKNLYVKTSGSSVANAILTGLTALIIEKYKANNKKYSPQIILSELKKHI